MPTCFAASTSSVPFGTPTFLPLIVRLMSSVMAGSASGPVRRTAAAVGDRRLVRAAVVLDRRDDRRRREVAERAQHLAADLPRQRQQEVDVADVALAGLDPQQHLVQPHRALAARRALAAALVAEELEHAR